MSAGERAVARDSLKQQKEALRYQEITWSILFVGFLEMKESGSVPRLLVNYKPLNERISSDQNPVAKIETISEALKGAKW